MVNVIAFLVGAVLGGLIAWRRKGNMADIVQYALVFGILFALAWLFFTIFQYRGG